DERQDLVEAIDHRAVEQPFVPLLQGRERHVAVDVARQRREASHDAVHELRLGGDGVRQQPLEPEGQPFLAREGDGSVRRLVPHDVVACSYRYDARPHRTSSSSYDVKPGPDGRRLTSMAITLNPLNPLNDDGLERDGALPDGPDPRVQDRVPHAHTPGLL